MAPRRDSVSVVGIGAMGQAIATTLLAAGRPVTVWNRSTGRAADLQTRGAVVAPTPADAARE